MSEPDLIEDRITHAEDAIRYAMNQTLYGDQRLQVPPMGRTEAKIRVMLRRIADAWLVLTGKANIE